MNIKRTGKTSLSENELLILDFLALLGKTNVKNLYEESYSIHLNINYSHGLSSKDLLTLLSGLVNNNLVTDLPSLTTFKHKDNDEQNIKSHDYCITERGGYEWSKERTPIWSKYCSDTTSQDDNIVEFCCIDEDVGRKFAEISCQANLYIFSLEDLSLRELVSGSLFNWIKFDQEFSWIARFNQSTEGEQAVDWNFYNNNRSWWRTLEELQSLI